MNWIICANGRGEPYAFEASSIKGSIRSALGDLLKAKQDKNREKPHYSIRENFVEVKIPRESVVVDPKEIEKYKL